MKSEVAQQQNTPCNLLYSKKKITYELRHVNTVFKNDIHYLFVASGYSTTFWLLFTSTGLLNLLLSGLNEKQSINCEIAFLINMFYDCLHTQKPNCINCKYLIVWLTDGKAIMQSINMSTSAPVSSLKVICILTSSSVMVASTANIVVLEVISSD